MGPLPRGGSPVVEPWGYTVDVGQAEHVTRHVFGATNDEVEEAAVRKVAEGVTGTGVWLKVFAEPSTVGAWLGEGWWIDPEPGYLMSVPLAGPSEGAGTEGAAPDGYRLRTWSRGGVTRVMVAAPDGSWAARGQIAPTGETAVVDQIETAERHRRRGSAAWSWAPSRGRRWHGARRPASWRGRRRGGRCTSPWGGGWRRR